MSSRQHQRQVSIAPTNRITSPASPSLPAVSTPASSGADSRTRQDHRLHTMHASSNPSSSQPHPSRSRSASRAYSPSSSPTIRSAAHSTERRPYSDRPLSLSQDSWTNEKVLSPSSTTSYESVVNDPLQRHDTSSPASRQPSPRLPRSPHSRRLSHPTAQPLMHQRHYAERTRPPSCITIPPAIRPWLPMCAWFATTIGFALAIAFWRTEVFEGLDNFSSWLKKEGYTGYFVLGFFIFLTTFPPLPMYSTFIVLAGYTFGAITGFIVSYIAALSGAFVVFTLFRHVIPSSVTASILPPSLKRVVHAIEKRPSIFLLVRVAPYPYNVLNAVLGSSSTMTLTRYILTTAASLVKIIVHAMIGSEIHSFSEFHSGKSTEEESDEEESHWSWTRIWTIAGIVLCVVLFIYLSFVARKAIDQEAESECGDLEEGLASSPSTATSSASEANGQPMVASNRRHLPLAMPGFPFPRSHANYTPLPQEEEEMVQRDQTIRPSSPLPRPQSVSR